MSLTDLELRAHDEAARVDARTVFDRPVVIEAGAGTGKTTILITRIVTWCLGPGWEEAASHEIGREPSAEEIAGRVADRVVAITFTEAAAAEMATRVGEALVAVERGEDTPGVVVEEPRDPDDRLRRARAMLAQVHRLRVSTIHSFCSWILLRFPVEAGVDPAFAVDSEGLKVESVVHEVIEDELRAGGSSTIWPRWLDLARAGVTPDCLAPVLALLVKNGVEAGHIPADPISDEVVDALRRRLRAACLALDAAIGGRLDAVKKAKKGAEAAERVTSLLAVLGGGPGEEGARHVLDRLRDLCHETLQAVGSKLDNWAKSKLANEEQELLEDRQGDVSEAAAELVVGLRDVADLRAQELEVVLELVRPLLAEVRLRLRARGVATFDDLLNQTSHLLASSKGVRCELRRGISQLLVDEFQDTDQAQCEIVWQLAMADETRDEPRPGLFIVGDPKQSIYGWRNADLEAYMGFVQRVESRGAVVRTLSVNFRSTPIILEEVERVVAGVMTEQTGLQPPFQRLLACEERLDDRGCSEAGRTPVEYWVNWPFVGDTGLLDHQSRVDESAELEAEAVAEDILGLHREQGVSWKQIGVLMRTTGKLDKLLAAFRRNGVPFEVARDREYYRQREVVEAAALVRTLIDPGDQVALLTVLRSDVVGVPDAAMLPLWRGGLPAALFALEGPDPEALAGVQSVVTDAADKVDQTLPGLDGLPHWPAALMAAVETVAVLRESLREEPAPVFVERLRSLWLAEITAAARFLGAHRIARLELFFADLEKSLGDGEGGFERVARLLRRAVAGVREAEQTTSPDLAEDAVQVMTVHGAKGLDFEHVYLLQMGAGTRSRGGETNQVLRHGDRFELRLFGAATPGLGEAVRRAEKHEAAELVRLLYVAMTRAKQRLVLSADWLARPGSGERLVKLLQHRWHEPTVSQLETAFSWRGSERNGEVQWVLPAFREAPAATPSVDSGRVFPCAPVGHEERLRQARERARARMGRAFSGGVSAAAHRMLESGPEGEAGKQGAGLDRSVATVVGTAVHRLLEEIDLEGDLESQLETGVRSVMDRLEHELRAQDMETARRRVREVASALAGGECLGRLRGLGSEHVLARELPMLLPPQPETGPVAVLVGVADLVYRDPQNGEIVVADYKTDAVSDDEGLAERSAIYEPQLGLYARGLEEALQLSATPRRELWFLSVDRVVNLDRSN